MTLNILTYTKDGARLTGFDGVDYTVLCACGGTFKKTKRYIIRPHIKLRCYTCYVEGQREATRARMNAK